MSRLNNDDFLKNACVAPAGVNSSEIKLYNRIKMMGGGLNQWEGNTKWNWEEKGT